MLLISNNLLSIIPEKMARKYKVIPIELRGDTLVVGGSKYDLYTLQDLNIITRKRIEFKLYPEDQIIKEIEYAYGNNIEVDEDYAYKIFETILERAIFENDILKSKEITLDMYNSRSRYMRLKESISRLLSPIL